MAKPSTPPSGRPAQGAGRNIPIEDMRGAAGDSQPSASQADAGTGSAAPSPEPGATAASSDPKGSAAGSDADRIVAEAEAALEGEPAEAAPTDSEQVAAAKAEAQEWQDKFLRLHAEWDTYRRRTTEQREVEKARDGRSGRDAEKSRGAPTEKEAAKTAEHAATEKQMSFVSALHDKGVISDEEMEDLGANPTVRDANALLNRHKEDAGYLELKKSRNAERDKRPLSERAEEARKASKALERDGKRRERQRTRKPRNRKDRGK